MFTIWNITYKIPQGSFHIKDTNFCNEEKEKKSQTINTKVFNQKNKPKMTKLI
jgi:hypothetical protein